MNTKALLYALTFSLCAAPCSAENNIVALDLSNASLDALPKNFQTQFPNLKALNLSANKYFDFYSLTDAPKSLEYLELTDCRITAKNCTMLMEILKRFQNLQELHISFSECKGEFSLENILATLQLPATVKIFTCRKDNPNQGYIGSCHCSATHHTGTTFNPYQYLPAPLKQKYFPYLP